MTLKKNIPLELWQVMQPWLDKNKDLVKMTPMPDVLMNIVDLDPQSDFCFVIANQQDRNNYRGYRIFVKPYSDWNLERREIWLKIDGIVPSAEAWINIIRAYNSTKTIYDDILEAQYITDYQRDFEIMDEDAETRTFDLNKQFLLTEYVERMEKYIRDSKDIADDDRSMLQNEAQKLKESILSDVKKRVIDRLVIFWAKCRRRSVKAGHFVLQEFVKEIIKEGVKRGFDIKWQSLPEYIEMFNKGFN